MSVAYLEILSGRLSREGLLNVLCGAGNIGNAVLVQLVFVLAP